MSTEIDDKIRQLQSVLTVGSLVIEEDDDLDDPDQIGVVVEPSSGELAIARQHLCGFTDEASEYVLVAWSWAETPDEVIDRRWEFIGELQIGKPQ